MPNFFSHLNHKYTASKISENRTGAKTDFPGGEQRQQKLEGEERESRFVDDEEAAHEKGGKNEMLPSQNKSFTEYYDFCTKNKQRKKESLYAISTHKEREEGDDPISCFSSPFKEKVGQIHSAWIFYRGAIDTMTYDSFDLLNTILAIRTQI